jgi:hypothetical protein
MILPYPCARVMREGREFHRENTCESGGTGRRTGLRIQPASPGRGSSPLSRTNIIKLAISLILNSTLKEGIDGF